MVCFWLSIVGCVLILWVVHCAMFVVVCCSLFVVSRLLIVVCRALRVIRWLLVVVCCL